MSRFPVSVVPVLPALMTALAIGGAFTQRAEAQSCPEPTATDFNVVTLANNAEEDLFGDGREFGNYGVVQMAVAPDGKVFIGKMCSGDVQVYTPTGNLPATTVRAGTVPTDCNNEDGLLGIVLDPGFETNNWIYVFHTDVDSEDFSNNDARNTDARAHMLTRYTYDGSASAGNRLTNPKVILRMPRILDDRPYHAAGGIDITSDGVLVIGTGDDTNPHGGGSNCQQNAGFGPVWYNDPGCDAQRSSSNTNDLRGKLLRIRPLAFPDSETPDPGIGSTYKIPPGNLWEFIEDPGFNPNWSAAVDSIERVRKEIYTMGHRNPYHPRIDTESGWIFTGEVGPDARSNNPSRGSHGTEEWNLATGPGFYGHPYCIADNRGWNALIGVNGSFGEYDEPYNCAAVQNTSPNNTGIRNLPPAREASLFYSHVSDVQDISVKDNYRIGFTNARTAVGGPMYRYDAELDSDVKFPPQYEGKVFFFDWANTNKASFRIITVNPDGSIDSGNAAVTAFPGVSGLPNGSYIDMRFGPEGAMYVLRNSSGGYGNMDGAALYRIEYTGTINEACYTPFNTTVGPVSLQPNDRPAVRRMMAPAISNGMLTLPAGYRTADLYDLSGRKVWTYRRDDATRAESVRIPARFSGKMLHARLLP